MESIEGYQDLVVLAQKLERRATELSKEADQQQSEAMQIYAASQNNSLDQVRSALQNCKSHFAESMEKSIKKADEEASQSLIECFGAHGVEVLR